MGRGLVESWLSQNDRISPTPHSGVVFATVPGSPQTGPKGPHMVQMQNRAPGRNDVEITQKLSYGVRLKVCVNF